MHIVFFADGPYMCGLTMPTADLADNDNPFCIPSIPPGIFCESYPPKATLVDDIIGTPSIAGADANYWATNDANGGSFIVNLGCTSAVTDVHLRNHANS